MTCLEISRMPYFLSHVEKDGIEFQCDSHMFSDTLIQKKVSNFWKEENNDLCETVMYWPILWHYRLSLLEDSFWYLTLISFFLVLL